MSGVIDYDLAARTAARLAPPGPQVGPQEAADVVAELRDLAVGAEQHVRAVTGLVPPGDPEPATVVDRAGWARTNLAGFEAVLGPLGERLAARQGALAAGATARVAGVELGALLAWLSSKVLGQYEVFLPLGQGAGRLLLVAPNLVETERQLQVDPHDFRLWVALHEVTHRTQFTAVPWMHAHVHAEVQALLRVSGLDDPAALMNRLKEAVTALPRARSLVELVATPQTREVLDRVTGFMSLLEGHAEYVMDEVGPEVVPSVALIRERFDERRRQQGGPVERLLRKALSLDLKALQYAEGAGFVRAVVGEVGMAGFNRVWEGPELLPARREIREPLEWVRRVHGGSAAA